MTDRYTRTVLTVIAGALIYLCIVMTPLPVVGAQSSARPGEPTGPGQVVIVGWRAAETLPVAFQRPVPIVATEPLHVVGNVTTERSSNVADRVIIAGWESGAARDKPGAVVALTPQKDGLPVQPQR